ncbi:MAG: YfhO family protein, partial [Deltaproteobacteria bacterium]|nr:YfhO family protein [Deltaproteobacteria bacterium]
GLLLLITVIPALDLAELTERAQRGLGYSLSFPLTPKQTILGLWVPGAGRPDAYMGLVPLFLITICIGVVPTRDRGIAVVSVGLSIFFLLLAFGAATPILGFLVENLPGFGLFRAANRYKLVSALFVALSAGYGASSIIRAGPKITRETIHIAGAALFVLAITTVLALKLEPAYADARPPIISLRFAVLIVAVVLGAAWLPARKAQWAVLALVPVMLFDPSYFWHTRGRIMEAKPNHQEDRVVLADLPRAGRALRIYDEFQLEQRVGSRLQVRDFRGYPSGDPLDLSRYRKVLSRIGSQPELLEAYNVGYVLSGPHHRNRTSKNRLKRRPSRVQSKDFAAVGKVDIARDPTPWVAWYNTALVVDEATALDALATQARRKPNARIAILEPGDAEILGDGLEELGGARSLLSGSGRVELFEADRVLTSVRLPSPALVVLNEVWYPGWKVYIDDEPATPVRANYLLRAVMVPAGSHVIEWRFEPKGYGWLLLAWALALLAVLLALFGPRARRAWLRHKRGY